MPYAVIPHRLQSLYDQEEVLREKALAMVTCDDRLGAHLRVVEQAMDLANLLRQISIDDDNFKVVQVLGMRTFNAFGASLKLALSGYEQNSALIMRDILETVFLLDLFSDDKALIEQWSLANEKEIRKHFSPAAVRKTLDKRDGFCERRREKMYKMFSEMAGHPTMKSDIMMRPQQDGDAVIGPFIESRGLAAVLFELGRLAVQVGNLLASFFPDNWSDGSSMRLEYAISRCRWLEMFYANRSD